MATVTPALNTISASYDSAGNLVGNCQAVYPDGTQQTLAFKATPAMVELATLMAQNGVFSPSFIVSGSTSNVTIQDVARIFCAIQFVMGAPPSMINPVVIAPPNITF